MSDAVKYHVIDPAATNGVTVFRCPHHSRSTFTFIPGIDGGKTKSGDCQCYAVHREQSDGRILAMIVRQDDEEQSTLRKFMGRWSAA
jgi:hypothetical protein